MKTKGCSIAKIWSDVTSNIRRTIRQGAVQCYDTDPWKIPIGDYDLAGQPDVRLRMRLQLPPPSSFFLFSSFLTPLFPRPLSFRFETTQPAHARNAEKRGLLVDGFFRYNYTTVTGRCDEWPVQPCATEARFASPKIWLIIKNALPQNQIPSLTTVSTPPPPAVAPFLCLHIHILFSVRRWRGASV